jgi:hypothetical protein
MVALDDRGEQTRISNKKQEGTGLMTTSATRATKPPPRWYWIVSALALVWMLIGVAAWSADLLMDQRALDAMSEGQRQLYSARPDWLFVVYAIAIFSGLLGTIGLLARKIWAKWMFAISLAAIVLQFGYTFLIMNAVQLIGAAAAVPFPLVIFAIGALLLWMSIKAEKSGWIR